MHDLIFSNIDMNEKSSIKPRKTSLIVSNHDDLIQFPWKTKSTYICVYVQRHVRTYIILMDWTMIRTHYFSVTFFFWGGWYFYKQIYVYSPAEDFKNAPNYNKKDKKDTSKVVTFFRAYMYLYMSESLLQCSLYVVIFKMTWLTALKFELQKKDCN